jgi:Na+/proline symporter
MTDGADYRIMLWAVIGYLIAMAILGGIGKNGIKRTKKAKEFYDIMRNIVNIVFCFTMTAFYLPFIGLSINIIYCND